MLIEALLSGELTKTNVNLPNNCAYMVGSLAPHWDVCFQKRLSRISRISRRALIGVINSWDHVTNCYLLVLFCGSDDLLGPCLT